MLVMLYFLLLCFLTWFYLSGVTKGVGVDVVRMNSSDQVQNQTSVLKVKNDESNRSSSEEPLWKKPLWKEPTLLNLTDFRWVINNESICRQPERSSKRLIPVLIHTSWYHYKERATIRKTWASVRDTYKEWDVRPVFLLGEQTFGSTPEAAGARQNFTEKVNESMHAEHKKYGDIVVGNFIDSYRNLSYKHLMGYKWILNFCPNAFFVIKTDDDVFIDIFEWLDWIAEDSKKEGSNSSLSRPDFHCATHSNTKPFSDKNHKWYVTKEEWPEATFPDYCNGHAYGITMDSIRKVYSVSKVKKFLWIDDVLVGVFRREARRKYGWTPTSRNIWPPSDVYANMKILRPYCEEEISMNHFRKKRPFRSIIHLPREKFDQEMKCLWTKVIFDRMATKAFETLSAANGKIPIKILLD